MILAISKQILSAPTAPHFENGVSAQIQTLLRRAGARIRRDRHGNFIAAIGVRPRVAFCAHMDHPGFRVLRARGRLIESEFLGWVKRPYFRRGTRVALYDAEGRRVGTARIHSTSGSWRHQKLVRLRLVSGEARAARFGMWDFSAFAVRGGRIHARACDDLIGCSAIVAALAELARRKKSAIGIFTRREEIGLCGAFEVAKARFLPRNIPVVSVETSRELCNARQGDGPIVRVGDRASIFDPCLTGKLCEAAVRVRGLRWQRRLMDGGTCEATAFNRHGYRASGLCIALGNYHNSAAGGRIAAENVHVQDLKGLVRLMAGIAGKV